MAFVRWNQITNIWEVAATPESPSTAWNHLPIGTPTLPGDTVNKAYVDGLIPAGGPFVPYNGANSNVNLAPYNLNAGRIVVGNVVDLGYPFTVSAPGQAGQLFLHTHSNLVHYYSINALDSTVATGHRFYTRTGTATDNLRFMVETYYVRVVGDIYVDGGVFEAGHPIRLGHWTTWTPAWKSYGGGADGTGLSIIGRYTIVGKTVFYYIEIVFTSITVFPASYWAFTLPPPFPVNGYNVSGTVTMATGGLYMNGLIIPGSYHYGIPNSVGIECHTPASPSVGLVSSFHPWTWADNHKLWISGQYETYA